MNKSWRQHPTRRQLYGHLPPIMKTIQVRWTRHTAGEARMNSSVMYSYGPPHMAKQKQDDQLEHTYSSYVRIRDVTLKTCQKRWMIGRSGERGSGISVLAVWHDDDDDLFIFILFIYIHLFLLISIYKSFLGSISVNIYLSIYPSYSVSINLSHFLSIYLSFFFSLTSLFCWYLSYLY